MAFDCSVFIRHVAERIIHEFHFSRGAGTPGLIGAAKEHPARVQLERLIPGGVAVGSGITVDSYGSSNAFAGTPEEQFDQDHKSFARFIPLCSVRASSRLRRQ
ncbi:hypothetical protein, partial [Mesorhizobium sp.]|uniref:hypothetical protein n=1 Tax=Mesorhizobium sp. TaxID=1871066 RepID=UPI0025EB522F